MVVRQEKLNLDSNLMREKELPKYKQIYRETYTQCAFFMVGTLLRQNK